MANGTNVPQAGWLRRAWDNFKQNKGKYIVTVVAAVGAMELGNYLLKMDYSPEPPTETPAAKVEAEKDIVTRLGLKNDIEYIAVQLDGTLRRTNRDGTPIDPSSRGYGRLSPIQILLELKKQDDSGYGIIKVNDKKLTGISGKYLPGKEPTTGTADQISIDEIVNTYLRSAQR